MGESGAQAQTTQPVRRVLVFSIVGTALLMMTLDTTIVATALPTLQEDLRTTASWVGWVITAYSLGFVLMLPVSDKLAVRFGRRGVFLASVGVFTAASLTCGLVSDIRAMIVLRALQAAGGAGFTPSATGIIVDHFGDARDRAVSLFGSIFSAGAMAGPVFGGLFVTYWTWRGVFFVNVPIGIVVMLLALRFVPPDRPESKRSTARMDPKGMALLGAGVLGLMLLASYLGESEGKVVSPVFVVLLAAGPIALAAFFRHLRRTVEPFIRPHLIHGRGFAAVNVINILYSGATIGAIALVPLYAANRYGIDALRASALLAAQGIASAVMSAVMTVALRRSGYRLPLYAGCTLMAVGMGALALPSILGTSPAVWLGTAAFVVGIGQGTIGPACRNAGLQLEPQSSGTMAALRSMAIQLGSIFTISIVTAIVAASGDSGIVQAWSYVAIAAVYALALPLISRVPEHHGSW